MKDLLIFGDSIAHGVGGQTGGWTDKLKTLLNGQLRNSSGAGTVLYELGIPGDTARDVLSRFEVELLPRAPHKSLQETIVVFAVGVNDSKAANKPNNFLSDQDQYATNMRACIKIAKEHATNVLCVGLLPVDESKASPRHTLGGEGVAYFSNRRIEQFEAGLVAVCKQEKTPCVPLFAAVPPNWQQHFLADGLHPNDAGHQWIFEQVKPMFRKILQ